MFLTVHKSIALRMLSTFDGLPPSSRNRLRLASLSMPLSIRVLGNYLLQPKRDFFKKRDQTTANYGDFTTFPSRTNLDNEFVALTAEFWKRSASTSEVVLLASCGAFSQNMGNPAMLHIFWAPVISFSWRLAPAIPFEVSGSTPFTRTPSTLVDGEAKI